MLKIIKRISTVSGSYKSKLYVGIVCNFFYSIFNSLPIIAVLIIITNINSLSMPIIMQAFWILLASLLGRCILKYLLNIFMSANGYNIFCEKRLELGDKLKKAPMGFFTEKNLGSITNTVSTAMTELENFSMMAVENVVGGVIQALLVTVFMMYFRLEVGLITIVGLILSSFVLHIIQKRTKKLAPIRDTAIEKTVCTVLEYVHGIGVVKSFGKEQNDMSNAFSENAAACIELEKKVMGVNGLFRGVLEVASAFVLMCAAYLLFAEEISFGVGVMLMISAFMVYGNMENMGNGAFLLNALNSALDRIYSIMEIPKMEHGNALVPKDCYDIELNNISFGYNKMQILHNVSFKIPQNSSTAIIGYSGSGKTTLCNLIVRFWDVNSGDIKLGGRNIKDYAPDELMSNFSMVFQKVYLFNDTIENNIKFGKFDATHEEVLTAAKKACCHDFISALSDGYETMIGEAGCNLSGGEKQRISIARAILKDAPVVILDEATASVDPENEHELLSAISELKKNKTIISIAHRMATVREADQIIVLDHGRISQKGTHNELIKQDGIYRNFLNIKTKSAGWVLS
jgi:ATP-binding cassette subfamily B protein IrtB